MHTQNKNEMSFACFLLIFVIVNFICVFTNTANDKPIIFPICILHFNWMERNKFTECIEIFVNDNADYDKAVVIVE